MKHTLLTLLILLVLSSCGTKKNVITTKTKGSSPKIEISKEEKPKIEISTKPKVKVTETKKKANIPISTENYISSYREIAMDEMKNYNIPASITLAQGILESGSGKGRLSVKANNHFGIKCHGWKGEKIYHDDDKEQECFRKYKDPKYSFRDHSLFLKGRKRYAKLFQLKQDDYKNWAKQLRAAGYATDKKYPEKLISLIERYNLSQYDKIVLGKNDIIKTPNTNSVVAHVIKQGDTLYSLSKKYNVSIENLKKLNKMDSNSLSIGKTLIIK